MLELKLVCVSKREHWTLSDPQFRHENMIPRFSAGLWIRSYPYLIFICDESDTYSILDEDL